MTALMGPLVESVLHLIVGRTGSLRRATKGLPCLSDLSLPWPVADRGPRCLPPTQASLSSSFSQLCREELKVSFPSGMIKKITLLTV